MKWLWAIVSLGLVGMSGCGTSDPPKEAVRPVRAVRVSGEAPIADRRWPGQTRPAHEVELSFRINGPLVALPIQRGQFVKKGEILGRVDPRDFETHLASAKARLATAEAQLKAMKAGARPEDIAKLEAEVGKQEANLKRFDLEVERFETLVKGYAAPQAELDRYIQMRDNASGSLKQAQEELRIGRSGARPEDIEAKEAEVLSLKAAMQAAQNQLADCVLKAPFDGKIAALFVENFQFIQAKQNVCRLIDLSQLEFDVEIPEAQIANAEKVREIPLFCELDVLKGKVLPAKLKEVSPEPNPTTRTYTVTLRIGQPEGERLVGGMAGVAYAERPPEGVAPPPGSLAVPAPSVFSDKAGSRWVWVVDPVSETVSKRGVKVGEMVQAGLTVEGLKKNEWVVVSGVHFLTEGQKVRLDTNQRVAGGTP